MKYADVVAPEALEAEGEIPWVKNVDGEALRVPLRALSGLDEGAAENAGTDWAKRHGRPDAKRGDALFDFGFRALCVALGYRDPDAPDEPFFEGGLAEVTALHPLQVHYLFEQHDAFQHRVSPYRHKLTVDEMVALLEKEVTCEDARFFTALSPSTRWASWHVMACLLHAVPGLKSWLTSLSSDGSTSTPPMPTTQGAEGP